MLSFYTSQCHLKVDYRAPLRNSIAACSPANFSTATQLQMNVWRWKGICTRWFKISNTKNTQHRWEKTAQVTGISRQWSNKCRTGNEELHRKVGPAGSHIAWDEAEVKETRHSLLRVIRVASQSKPVIQLSTHFLTLRQLVQGYYAHTLSMQ